MKREQDRIRIASEICSSAALYRQHLVGKCFMYVFDNRYIEVIYKICLRFCFDEGKCIIYKWLIGIKICAAKA